jgi:hypothetical protein
MLNDVIKTATLNVLKVQNLYPDRQEQCFLSAYQIAALVKSKIKLSDVVGGEGQAPHFKSRDIAQYLSTLADNGEPIERIFFSTDGMDDYTASNGKKSKAFLFDGGNVPSNPSFSMFRWVG